MAETPAGPADTPAPCLPRPAVASDLGFVRRPIVAVADLAAVARVGVRCAFAFAFAFAFAAL